MIQEGGDTDTNACIVGGMLGALLGLDNIPQHMIDKVLNFDCTKIPKNKQDFGKKRPKFLSTKIHLVKNITKLLSIRPN